MSTPRNSGLEPNNSQLPKWQLKLIEQIVFSMNKNYIHFNKNGKTEEFWKIKLIAKFIAKFLEFPSEQNMMDAYKNQFKEKPNIYFFSEKDKITQDFIDQTIQDKYAIILNGEGKQRFIYCIIDGKLSQDILFRGKSWNEIEVDDDLGNVHGKLDPTNPYSDSLIEDSLTNSAYTKFAEEVTIILQDITKDEHLSFGYYPYFIKPLIQSDLFKTEKLFSKSTPLHMSIDEGMKTRLAQSGANYGFSITINDNDTVIPTNVGYLKIKEIFNLLHPSMESVQKHVFNLMSQFQDKDSIIIDLRDCPGGTPQGVKYLASFFFDKPTHLSTYIGKNPGGEPLNESLFTDPLLQSDGKSLLVDLSKKPLYILIGTGTFSAAEEIAYDLQQLKRAQLVGTQTKGGNHFTRGEPLLNEWGECDERFIIPIPSCYSINPVSGTNWEDGPLDKGEKPGVRPDIPILENQDALKTALHRCKLWSASLSNSGIFPSSQNASSTTETNKEQASVTLRKSSNDEKP